VSTADEQAAATTPSILSPSHRALTIGIVSVVLLVAFEAMAVATAMPVAAQDLDGLPLFAWTFSAFLITSLVGMVVAGEVADRIGPRWPFLTGIGAFALGLVFAGLARTMSLLIGARALQGFGAGLLIVVLYVMVGRAYPEAMRPRVFAAMSSGWVLPSIIGPSLAGWLTLEVSWRAVLQLSPPGTQGVNSAGLQVSDSVGAILLVGAAGALYAGLRTGPGQDAHVFALIFALMGVVAAAGAVLGARVRPTVDEEPMTTDGSIGLRAPLEQG